MFKFKRRNSNFPIIGIISMTLTLMLLPYTVQGVLGWFRGETKSEIAPLFTSEVQHWGVDVTRWAKSYDLDPNLMATVMQIESCGHPTVVSPAGAQGLFQVMPFHFDLNENMLDPDTNAYRSANFLLECSRYAGDNPGLILACYNGGPRVTQQPFHYWPHETQRYYVWGLGIYYDAQHNRNKSQTLDQWLGAGGQNLCNLASGELKVGWRNQF